MGSFQEYVNRKSTNITETTSNSSSSFMNYINKRNEEEEERKRLEIQRQQEEKRKKISEQTSKKTDEIINKINNSNDLTELQKTYSNLPMAEQAALAKKAQETANSIVGKLGLVGNNQSIMPITNVDENKLKTKADLDKKTAIENAKKVPGTIADVALNTAQGFAGVGENIADFLAAGIAEAAEATGHKEYAERVRRNIASSESDIFTNTLQKGKDSIEDYSWSGDTLDQMFQGVGQTGAYAALNAIPGAGAGLSTGAMFTSAAGGELSNLYGSEDYKEGDLRKGKIWAKTIGSGAIEAAAERMLGYFGSTGGIDKTAANYLSNLASSSIGKIFARQGVNALAEGVEEVISYTGNYLLDSVIDWVDKKTGGTGEALRQPWKWQDLWQQAFTAAGSALIMGGFDTAVTAKSVNGTSVSDALNKTAQKMDLNAQLEGLQSQEENLQKRLGKNISQQEIGNTFNELQNIQNQAANIQSQLETLPTARQVQQLPKATEVAPRAGQALENTEKSSVANQKELKNALNRNGTFSEQVDKYVEGKLPSGDFLYLGETPAVLQNLGIPNNEVILKQSKLKTLMKESNNNTDKLHGINAETIKKIPEAIAKPLNILQSSTNENSVVIITDLADTYERPIIASIEINYDGQIGNIDFLSNRLTSAYGKNNYDRFMQTEIAKGNLLYDIDEGIIKELPTTRLQSPKGISSSVDTNNNVSTSNNSIPSSTENVNTTNKYAQNVENDTQNIGNVNKNEKPTRHEVIQKNRELARESIANISKWKDKKNGLSYQMETMERNMYDIIPDKAEAKKINETYFEPIHTSEAEKQKFINKYNNQIRNFKLNKYESEAVQFLGEKKYNPDFNKGDGESLIQRNEIQGRIDNNVKNGKIDIEKVNNAIETFRNIYDELFETENNALRENGYQEKPYRKGYFPHFIDYVPVTKTEKVLNALGFKIDKRALPTDIAGITEQFVPGKTWNKSALERKTNKTDYNALKGFDTYIQQAADNIFHTKNIQRLRGLENEIRYQYSDKGMQERIDKILNDETLFEEEKQDLIDNIFGQAENPLPNLVTELRRYTNALANKKSEADRTWENKIGRHVYSTVNAIENRFAANAVGLNIGSAVTNFIPITQAYSQVSTKNMNRAIIDTMKSQIRDDGFVDKSAFLTSRLNQAEKLYKTNLEKATDKANVVFTGIDSVASNIVVRGKYLENIEKGMSETEAIKDADQFARKVMADRSKGALPTIFEEKNPVTKAFTQFQLEVNNQYRYMFKDIPRDLRDKGLGAIALAFFKMFAAAWFYNEASEKVTGRRAAFDPIDIVKSSYKTITDDKLSTYNKITKIGKELTEDAPFIGGFVGGGRVPVNGALPSVSNLAKSTIGLATGEMDSKKALNNISKEVSKPLYYLAPPLGGGQIKKSVEGLKTVSNGGSYGIDSKGRQTLQFPVEKASAKDYIKAGIFGKYALPTAKDYAERGYKSLTANQTELYKNSNVPYNELLEYIDSGLKKNEDKIDYINKTDWSTNQKWGVYTSEIFSNTERKNGGSQLEDAQYITSNGVSKAEYMKIYNNAIKNSVDMPTKEDYIKIKNNNLTLKTYMDYKTKLKGISKSTEEAKLKDKEKIQIVIDSSYSNQEKLALYENYINSKDSVLPIVKSANININEYLKYKTQDFSADKEDDGTIKGKTISGSKKEKVYNYIENMNITYMQKLMLYGMEYTLSDNEQGQIANYINSLNKTKSEKLDMLSKFQGTTIYKDGSFKY